MAYWGRIISTHAKCWRTIKLPSTNKSPPNFVRAFSNHAAEQNSLIQEAGLTQELRVSQSEPKTFEELFKKSSFVALGNPKGKIVVGTIKKVVENNAYIDFGWKFPCVCAVPTKGTGSYIPGRKVRLLIRELEMATKFLGCDKELTLNEADCVLLGLITKGPTVKTTETQLSDDVNRFLWENPLPASVKQTLQSVNIEELSLSLKKDDEEVQETIAQEGIKAQETSAQEGIKAQETIEQKRLKSHKISEQDKKIKSRAVDSSVSDLQELMLALKNDFEKVQKSIEQEEIKAQETIEKEGIKSQETSEQEGIKSTAVDPKKGDL